MESYDYSRAGAYFITICTKDRCKILSRIVGVEILHDPITKPKLVGGDVLDAPKIELTKYGKITEKYINQLNNFYDHIIIDQYVIMPNHIHIMLYVLDNGASRTSPPTRQHSTLSQFVSTFKRFCNKECGQNIWQRQFHDHIIRNREDYEEHSKYIYENPINWHNDELYIEE